MFKNIIAATALSFFALTAAHATTITSVAATDATLTTLALNSLDLPNGGSWLTPAPTVVSGDLGGVYRSPFENLGDGIGDDGDYANYSGIEYWNVAGTGAAANTATLALTSLRSTLSFLWGSPDGYNFVTLINSLTSAEVTFSLADLLPVNTVGRGAEYVTIAGFSFDTVEFVSTSPAGEFSNISAVPLPAGGLLLIGAIGGLAALRRRKMV